MNYKVLRPRDIDPIIQLEKNILRDEVEDEIEREFVAWRAPWRVEALEHYLALGWSFALWETKEEDSPLLGYFLAQPLLFFRGMAQSLWLEHLQAPTPEIKNELLDIAYRLCRDKHFQNLLVPTHIDFDKTRWQDKLKDINPQHFVFSTSKIIGKM